MQEKKVFYKLFLSLRTNAEEKFHGKHACVQVCDKPGVLKV